MAILRRDLLRGALSSPLWLQRGEAQVTPDVMKYTPEIEPLVGLIERTPREQCAAMAVEQLRAGFSYRQFLAALFLAGIRNINPRPPGFALHCVFVVHSAHLISLEAPADVRLLPLFYVLDDFKVSQDRDAKNAAGDYTMRELGGRLPAPERATGDFHAAMDAWDPAGAERAIASLARSRSGGDVFGMLWRYGARDYRNIGHKAIFTANACRTLHAIGWQYAEPVLRSLALALVDFAHDQRMNGYALDDQCYAANVRQVKDSFAKLHADWVESAADAGATRSIVAGSRDATPAEACADVAARLVKGQANAASVWDAVHLAAAELRMRARRGAALASIHAVTSANALHYAYNSAADPRDRYLLLLQAVGWIGQFRSFSAANPDNLRAVNILELEAAPAAGPVEEILARIREQPDESAARVLRLARDLPARRVFLAAAMRAGLGKVDEVHYYKFLAALIEDLPLVSPEWQPHLAATTVYYLKGPADAEPAPMKRAREALRNLAA